MACAQLHQGVGIHRDLVLKCFHHCLCAVALSAAFHAAACAARSSMFIFTVLVFLS